MNTLQYISQGNTPQEHLINIGRVCEAGCRWVQLRLKNVTDAVAFQTALQARAICDQYQATLIINDRVDIVHQVKADGVHLGLEDMNPKEARVILGKDMIIGGTANTLEDCKQHIQDGVDYIGLGPFRHTTTKKKLSPVLGISGYREIMNSAFRIQYAAIPIIAIGGITIPDLPELMTTGITGIAVSGILTHQEAIEETIDTIYSILNNNTQERSGTTPDTQDLKPKL